MEYEKDIDKYNEIIEIRELLGIPLYHDNPNGDYPYNFYLYAKHDYATYDVDKIYKEFKKRGFKCSFYYDEEGDHLFEVYYHKVPEEKIIYNEINLMIQEIERKYGITIEYEAKITTK